MAYRDCRDLTVSLNTFKISAMSEPDVSELISVERAIEIIDAVEVSPRTNLVPLEQAQGLRLAVDIHADRDYPPFDKSLMDGFAVSCASVGTTPVNLVLVGEIPAGRAATRAIHSSETMAIMTGAPLPPGADGVVPVEDVQAPVSREIGQPIRILRADNPTRYVTRQGSDIRHGRGALLGPAQLAVAASVGMANLECYLRPRVAVLSTGDELVPIDGTPAASQIRNSNNIMLVALLRQFGCEVRDLGTAPDRPDAIRAAILKGLELDALCVTGGMSMGEYDYVPKVLAELGVYMPITKLKIKPGKPFVFGMRQTDGQAETKFIFGLPGNPVSAFVCVVRLASRLLRRMGGATVSDPPASAPLARPLPANGPREFYQPAVLERGLVLPLNWKGSADLYTLARANILLLRPAHDAARAAGETVSYLCL